MFQEVRMVDMAYLYGTPGKMDEILEFCRKHKRPVCGRCGGILGVDQSGCSDGHFRDVSLTSYNGNKSLGATPATCFLTDSEGDAYKVRKWSTQSQENAAWYQHEELGYNFRMSNLIGGVSRVSTPI